MSKRVGAACVLVIGVGLPGAALAKASGMLKDEVRLTAIADARSELLVEGTQIYCTPSANGEGTCSSFPYALVVSFDGQRKSWFVPKGHEQANAYVDGLGEGPASTLEALPAYLKYHGFVAEADARRRSASGCRFWFDRAKRRGRAGEPPSAEYTVRVANGLQRLHKIALGTDKLATSHRVEGIFLPERRALLVWASLPTCTTRGGSCAEAPEIKTVSLGPPQVPDLAQCFAPREAEGSLAP